MCGKDDKMCRKDYTICYFKKMIFGHNFLKGAKKSSCASTDIQSAKNIFKLTHFNISNVKKGNERMSTWSLTIIVILKI